MIERLETLALSMLLRPFVAIFILAGAALISRAIFPLIPDGRARRALYRNIHAKS